MTTAQTIKTVLNGITYEGTFEDVAAVLPAVQQVCQVNLDRVIFAAVEPLDDEGRRWVRYQVDWGIESGDDDFEVVYVRDGETRIRSDNGMDWTPEEWGEAVAAYAWREMAKYIERKYCITGSPEKWRQFFSKTRSEARQIV